MSARKHGPIEHSQIKLARTVLVQCERCRVMGPVARYREHLEQDHGVKQ